jgi:hypothetical protein
MCSMCQPSRAGNHRLVSASSKVRAGYCAATGCPQLTARRGATARSPDHARGRPAPPCKRECTHFGNVFIISQVCRSPMIDRNQPWLRLRGRRRPPGYQARLSTSSAQPGAVSFRRRYQWGTNLSFTRVQTSAATRLPASSPSQRTFKPRRRFPRSDGIDARTQMVANISGQLLGSLWGARRTRAPRHRQPSVHHRGTRTHEVSRRTRRPRQNGSDQLLARPGKIFQLSFEEATTDVGAPIHKRSEPAHSIISGQINDCSPVPRRRFTPQLPDLRCCFCSPQPRTRLTPRVPQMQHTNAGRF